MKNFRRKYWTHWSGLALGALLFAVPACDLLEDDILPNTELDENLVKLPQSDFTINPESGRLLVDLSAAISSNTDLTISIETQPLYGSVEILDARMLSYEVTQAEFAQSQGDSFVFKVKQGERTFDTDTINIKPGTPGECTDEAVVSYVYGTSMDSVLEAYPIYAADSACGFIQGGDYVLEILTQPSLGEASTNGEGIFYFPKWDQGSYETYVIWKACSATVPANCRVGLLKIFITDDTTGGCELAANFDEKWISVPNDLGQDIRVDVTENDALCNVTDWELTVDVAPSLGQAYVSGGDVYVNFADVAEGQVDSLVYKIYSPSLNSFSYGVVGFYFVGGDSTGGGTGCDSVLAISDQLTLYADSVQQYDTVYSFFDVVSNDVYCDLNNVQVSITQSPQYGNAWVEGQGVKYVRVIASGTEPDDTFRYQLCDGNACSTAEAYIDVIQ